MEQSRRNVARNLGGLRIGRKGRRLARCRGMERYGEVIDGRLDYSRTYCCGFGLRCLLLCDRCSCQRMLGIGGASETTKECGKGNVEGVLG